MAAVARIARFRLRAGDCEGALDALARYNYARGAYEEGRKSPRSPGSGSWKLTTGVALDLQASVAGCFKKRRK